jgi:hypothetical protein
MEIYKHFLSIHHESAFFFNVLVVWVKLKMRARVFNAIDFNLVKARRLKRPSPSMGGAVVSSLFVLAVVASETGR